MTPTTPPTPATNGEITPIPIQGVLLSEADYRKLLAERQELAEARARIKETEAAYAALLNNYRSVHHAYYELVKDDLEPDDPNWTPPPPEETVTAEEILAMIDREFGGK